MANIKSAKKRVKVTAKKQLRNRSVKSAMKTSLKKFYAVIESGDKAAATAMLPQITAVVDKAGAVVNGWIKTAEFPTWQSSVYNILNGTHFSFVNKSLIVNGTTYANSDVSNATASVDADGNVTINFTVGGTAYVFKHNKQ